jgi:hypothetical protein
MLTQVYISENKDVKDSIIKDKFNQILDLIWFSTNTNSL